MAGTGNSTICFKIGDTLDLPPYPVTVTTRIITCLVGNPYKPLFTTVTGWGGRSKRYIDTSTSNVFSIVMFVFRSVCFFFLKKSAAIFFQKIPSLKLTQVPENRPSQRKHVFQPSIFRGYSSFRGGGGKYNKKTLFLMSAARKLEMQTHTTHEFTKNMTLSPITLAFQIPPEKRFMYVFGVQKGCLEA